MVQKRMWALVVCLGVLGCFVPVARAGQPVTPGTVIFDMDTHLGYCDPDYFSFFGYPTTDFGSNGADAEDGHAVFTAGNWTNCDLVYGSGSCQFLGSKHGGGRLCCGQPLCGGLGSGVRDADLDLSQGTGITMRVLLKLPTTESLPGVRLQFQLADTNGNAAALDPDTTAVMPRAIPGKPFINRSIPLADDEQWHTYTIWFKGLDWSFDASAVAGLDPLTFDNINAVRPLWRRGTAEYEGGSNVIVFDEITLIDDPPVLWADADGDGDVDVEDFAAFQKCFGLPPTGDCERMDANYDSRVPDLDASNDVVNIDDLQNFLECLQGPGVTTEFPSWCY